jgi:hypothetical protein
MIVEFSSIKAYRDFFCNINELIEHLLDLLNEQDKINER